ncbi:hypothetical protein LX64_01438 [Chitinophaga skermanii]|uniref:Uncharacterized protein n=1 Tax=Chitinophaga skermanii TaxID=331697 RepID=A0A327QYJ1_9BACT|nr:hypothetical protein LX64_01438 [Chitinophaga skermanii]
MKLIGSLTEQQFRKELIQSQQTIFSYKSPLLLCLKNKYPGFIRRIF